MDFGNRTTIRNFKPFLLTAFIATVTALPIADARMMVKENERLVLIDVDANGNLASSFSGLKFTATAKYIAFFKSKIQIARNSGKVTNLSRKRQVFKNTLGPKITPTITSIMDGTELPVTKSRVVVSRRFGTDKAKERILIVHNPNGNQISKP